MRLLPCGAMEIGTPYGFVRLGWIPWSGDFGFEIAWGFQERGPGYRCFRHSWTWAWLSREAWQDYRWWALSPVHLCRHTFSRYDPEVYRHPNVFLPHHRAEAWTGRDHEIIGITLTLFRYRWVWTL